MPRSPAYVREAALDAAMILFWRKGFQSTSLKDLETALKMRPGSIYAAFHSKEALFRDTLDLYAERMARELIETVETSETPLAALRAHLLSLADIRPADRPSTACMLVKSLLEVPRDSDLRAAIIAHIDRVEGILSRTLHRARDLGHLAPDADPDRIARKLQTYIFGLKIQAQRETDPDRMLELCRDLADEIDRLGPDAARSRPG